jgi:histone-lysine N-methyltransferase SETD8
VKGTGVKNTKPFKRGDFVCEYAGDLISSEEAMERERQYNKEDEGKAPEDIKCYMYFLKFKGKTVCIDATHAGRIGRYINHSRKGNLVTKMFVVDGVPRLALMASKDIPEGTELLYDYGERSKSVIEEHPWLKS